MTGQADDDTPLAAFARGITGHRDQEPSANQPALTSASPGLPSGVLCESIDRVLMIVVQGMLFASVGVAGIVSLLILESDTLWDEVLPAAAVAMALAGLFALAARTAAEASMRAAAAVRVVELQAITVALRLAPARESPSASTESSTATEVGPAGADPFSAEATREATRALLLGESLVRLIVALGSASLAGQLREQTLALEAALTERLGPRAVAKARHEATKDSTGTSEPWLSPTAAKSFRDG